MKKTIFTGMATALVTPMTPQGIDYDSIGRFIDFQIDNGIRNDEVLYADNYDTIRIYLNAINCVYDGSWSISYEQ